MDMILERIAAMLPVQSAAAGAHVANVHNLRDWLERLQLAHRGFALSRLHEALTEFNAVLMRPRQRLAMLEMFDLACASFINDLKNEVREVFPMSSECVGEIRLVDGIERELAIGHIDAVCGFVLSSGKVPFLQRSTVAAALVRACACQKTRLWMADCMHSAPPEGLWQSLHDLFVFAVASGCDKRESQLPRGAARASVRSLYTQALLQAFARPKQLTQTQNRQLYESLPVLASWCEVKPGRAAAEMIAVHVASDCSPPAVRDDVHDDDGEHWMLDVTALRTQLDATPIQDGAIRLRARDGGAEATLPMDLVDALARGWSRRIERESPRSADGTLLETEIGMVGLHHILSGSRDFESVLPSDEAPEYAMSWVQRPSGNASGRRARAEMVDHSRHGGRLRWVAGENARARVGELIAFAPVAQGERHWSFGALRWLCVDAQTGVEAGVELLSASLAAVAVYPLDVDGVRHAPVRGLLMGGDDHEDGGMAAIFVAKPFARTAAMLEVLRIENDPGGTTVSPARVTQFETREAGLYLKILLPAAAIHGAVQGA